MDSNGVGKITLWLVILMLLVTACGPPPTPVEEAVAFCTVHDNGNVDCVDRNLLARVALDIEGMERLKSLDAFLDEFIDSLTEAGLDDNVVLSCGAGDIWVTAQVPDDFDGEKITDEIIEQLQEACAIAIESAYNDPGVLGGGAPTRSDALVQQAIDKMDASVEKCYETGGGIAPTESKSPVQVKVEIKVDVNKTIEQIAQGIAWLNERRSTKEPVQKMTIKVGGTTIERTIVTENGETTTTTDVTKTNPTTGKKTTTRTVCTNGACKPPEPVPPPKPKPPPKPEPKPEPKPDDDKDPMYPACLDTHCTSTCDERKAWWERFKAECDRMNWQQYECRVFVARQNGCPDPGVVMPAPDQDYHCGLIITEFDLAVIRLQMCEARQGVMHPGPDGDTVICRLEESYEMGTALPDLCNDPRAIPTEDHVCTMEIPIPRVGQGPDGLPTMNDNSND